MKTIWILASLGAIAFVGLAVGYCVAFSSAMAGRFDALWMCGVCWVGMLLLGLCGEVAVRWEE